MERMQETADRQGALLQVRSWPENLPAPLNTWAGSSTRPFIWTKCPSPGAKAPQGNQCIDRSMSIRCGRTSGCSSVAGGSFYCLLRQQQKQYNVGMFRIVRVQSTQQAAVVFTQWSQPSASMLNVFLWLTRSYVSQEFRPGLTITITVTDCISDCVLQSDHNNPHFINPVLKYVGQMKAVAAVVCSWLCFLVIAPFVLLVEFYQTVFVAACLLFTWVIVDLVVRQTLAASPVPELRLYPHHPEWSRFSFKAAASQGSFTLIIFVSEPANIILMYMRCINTWGCKGKKPFG